MIPERAMAMIQQGREKTLARTLLQIEAVDAEAKSAADPAPAYQLRYRLVLRAMYEAICAGYQAGIRIDPDQPAWPVCYVELPGGHQLSWHMPEHGSAWDGHTTEVKYERVRAYAHAHGVTSWKPWERGGD